MPALNGDCSATSISLQDEPRGRAVSPARFSIPTVINAPEMESLSLLEGIQLDPRPTFVLDTACTDSSSTHILVLNPALEARPNLYHALKDTTHLLGEFTQLSQPILLYGLEWDHYMIGGRWRVMSIGSQSKDIKGPWSRSASIRPSKYPENLDNSQDHFMNSSLKRKSSDKSLKSRLRSPPAPLKIAREYDYFLSLFNWDAMKLGPIHTWDRRLREWFFMILVDPRPACIYWGNDGPSSKELIFLYNEPHIAVLGDHHPSAMGLSLQDAFPDLWGSINEPLWEEMVRSKQPFIRRALPISYSKYGQFLEERHFDWTSMPILDHQMGVTGSYQSLIDVTHIVFEQRRAATLSRLGGIVTSSEIDNIWDRITQNMLENNDLPQALVYSLGTASEDPTRLICKLEGSIGCKQSVGLENFQLDSPDLVIAAILQYSIQLDEPLYLSKRKSYSSEDIWSDLAPEDARHSLCNALPTLLAEFKPSASGDPCDSIAVMPIRLSRSHQVKGFVLVGLNTRAPYDHAYASFITLLQQTVSTTTSSVLLWREDRLISKEAKIAHADLSAQLLRSTQETKAIENRFSQLARHAPVGICIYAADGSMAFANTKWYSLTDFPQDADNQSPGWWSSIVYPDDMTIAFESFSQLQVQKQSVHFEIRLDVASKQYPLSKFTWVLVSAYPEMRDGEDLESIVACFTDITEQKLAAETERRRTVEAVEAKRQQETFIDVTSHEIRNPLSVSLQCSEEIASIANAGLRGISTKATEVCLPISELQDILNAAECIEQCTMHQRRIVDDILTMSKLEGGMLPFNLSAVQPMIVVKDVLKIFSRESVHSGIEITLQPDQSLEMVSKLEFLKLDPGRLSQMIINLLTNAIKFTKTQAQRHIEITIGASATLEPLNSHNLHFLPILDQHKASCIGTEWAPDESVYIHILVTDSGSGILPEDQDTVFSRFSQGCTKDYTQYGGSGLGLYICRALVEIHGGQIGFKSTRGKGSTFGFCLKTQRVPELELKLPSNLQNGKPKMSDGNVTATEANRKSKFHILIVEDNEINQKVLSKQLKKAGHQVTIANHGQGCLEKLAESHFCKDGGTRLSIVLMDVEMPVMNGVECTKAIRSMEKDGRVQGHVPIISTTGNARSEKVDLIKDAGVDRVILKPYSVIDLLQLVDDLIPGDSFTG